MDVDSFTLLQFARGGKKDFITCGWDPEVEVVEERNNSCPTTGNSPLVIQALIQ
jgi:hypothetical protein